VTEAQALYRNFPTNQALSVEVVGHLSPMADFIDFPSGTTARVSNRPPLKD
jgi:hypothetical protein